ncbi:conjugal transfer protein TraL [Volucribacter amazonae]|uniref:Conjugal transfer protein TraL n=1 Tax=Volucribacter amazonae TaxID=256731 RepID=A0A9X4SLQ0_9PAST|nr:conjugal transfer protein TraL [Volucribacter amazonae]MDG6896399.1 conjugal transfer protein TraL [Volucribacter amazonae]
MKLNTINLTLQGKGGVGKSFITSILAQYLKDYKGLDISGADTDSVNKSFAGFKALNVIPIDIMENDTISQAKFDSIFELMINDEKNTFVIDNGASTFIPILKYIKDNGVIEIFDETKKEVFIHTVIVGGQSQNDTLQNLITLFELIKNSNNVKLVIWLNEFQGKITDAEKVFKAVANKTSNFIIVENKNSDAFTTDLEKLTKNRLTLNEALISDDFNLMAKQRLKRVFNDIYAQLDQIYDVAQSE